MINSNKFRYNPNFTPVELDDGDEYMANGIFIFNITKMITDIKSNPTAYNRHKISVAAYRDPFVNLNEEYIPNADLAIPIIAAEIRPGQYTAIDGRHRLEKAHREGVAELEAYILPPEQHTRFLTTQKGYEAFIQYWNLKIDDDERDRKVANK